MPHPKKQPSDTAISKISQEIRSLMLDIGGTAHLKGFNYLCRAVELVYERPEMIHKVVNGIYAKIADEYKTSAYCVERDIRTELRSIFEAGQLAMLNEHFHYFSQSAKPLSARRFITLFTETLRRRYAYRTADTDSER